MFDVGQPHRLGCRTTRRRPAWAVALLATAALVTPAAAHASATGPALVATKTVLTASATTSHYDATVGFTAHVTAAHGAPAGSVTFLDGSTGSILDSVALSGGVAHFATAALAPGQRRVVAEYAGSFTDAVSYSAAVPVTVASTDDATAVQVDPVHDGHQAADALTPASLARKWSATFPGLNGTSLTTPLVADGEVFTSASPHPGRNSTHSTVYAVSQATGHLTWSARLFSDPTLTGLAYDGHALFTVDTSGKLTALAAATGHVLWSVQMPASNGFTAPPTAWDGVVYFGGPGPDGGGDLFAVSEADGVLDWTGEVWNGDLSSPAVDASGVWVSYVCQQDYHFAIDGELGWHNDTNCEGYGGSTPVLHDGRLYAEGYAPNGDTPVILSAATGATTGTFTGTTLPAFGQGNRYVLDGGELVATSPAGAPHWTFGGAALTSAPVTDRSDVFAETGGGTVYAFSSAGHQVWSGPAAASSGTAAPALAIGDGLLVTTNGSDLTAFSG